MASRRKNFTGRGAQIRPPNRFAPVRCEPVRCEPVRCEPVPADDAAADDAPADDAPADDAPADDAPAPREVISATSDARPTDEWAAYELVSEQSVMDGWSFDEARSDGDGPARLPTQYYPDQTRSIVTENQSPDIGFRYSLNPYRGCAHGCSYCYARPTHEYLGLDAGLDFETKILVKHDAPQRFRDWLSRDRYVCEMIMFSGVTDCYQPAEREYALTRACLQVAAEAGQPVSIVTKNALVTRDKDILQAMSARGQAHVAVSITTLDQSLARHMEPRTSSPRARLDALRQLTDAGVPTQVMVAPVIPGLNDHEIPRILEAARDAGAQSCGYVLLRLPLTVVPVFLDWLDRQLPLQAERIKHRIHDVRGGGWNDAQFGRRMRGVGPLAEQIQATFRVFARRLGYLQRLPELNTADFRPPVSSNGQRWLF